MQKGNYADADVYAGSDATPPILLAVFGRRPTDIFGSMVKYALHQKFFTGMSQSLGATR